MLDKKVLHDETAIEEMFCKPFGKLKVEEMDDELSELLIILLMRKSMEIPEKEKPFLLKVIDARIKGCFNYKINDIKLLLFLCAVTQTPGKAVMYLTYLEYWTKENGVDEINLDLFCEKIFPWGFPSDKDLNDLWDAQKVMTERMSVNLLDSPIAGKSLQLSKTEI